MLSDKNQMDPGAREVVQRLLRNGASRKLVQLALDRIERRGAVGLHAIDAAAEVVGRIVRFLPSPRRRAAARFPYAFAFCGPERSGKSSAQLRLARRMQEAGRRVLCARITLPDEKIPDARELGLDLPCIEIQDGGELERGVKKHSPDVLLIDTPGLSPGDPRALAALGKELRSLAPDGNCQLILCLPATLERQEMRAALGTFRGLRPVGVCLTHLDRTPSPIPAFEEVARAGLPLAFLSGGPGDGDFQRPSVDRVADFFLRRPRVLTPSPS